MKLELQSASNFLVHLIRRRHTGTDAQLERFKVAIVEVLRRRYRDHWFPDKPCKGSGYRCIRINGKIDPVIAQAAEIVGMPTNTIHQTFPSELTMWIDPLEVSYRIGENGSICILYEFKENVDNVAWKPTSSSSTSTTSTTSSSSGHKGQQQQQRSVVAISSVSSSPVKHIDNQLPKSTPTSPHHHSSSNFNHQQQQQLLKNNSGNLNTTALNNSKNSAAAAAASACKDSLYKIDFLIDPRKSASISEHLAAYVSS